MAGKFKNQVVETKTVTMSTSEQPQNEVQIPVYGDIAAVEVTLAQLTTGTLTTAKTLDYSVKGLVVKDRSGVLLMQNIRGVDLLFLERYRNIGRSRTIATTSSSSQTEQFYIPLNVEAKDQEAKMQISISPYSDMAASGATGGTVTYTTSVWYYTVSESVKTEKIQRITKSVVSGANTFGNDLPKNLEVSNLLFKIGTESNITNVTFTGDGNKEMDSVTMPHLIGIDNAKLVSGHVTGEFALYNAPFFSTAATRFDIVGAGSDTMEIFVVSAK
jgi:hypothetical protein